MDTSRSIYTKECSRIVEDQREQCDRLYTLLYARAGITDPYLRGPNKTRQALESGEAPMKDIEHYVCLWFGVDPSEIHTTSRKQRLNDPRSMCMYFMYKLGHTLTSIGEYYKKDHTTVLHHYYAISDRAEVDDDTKHIINRIELMIYDTTRTVHNRPETNTIPARDTTLFAGSHKEQPRNAIMV